MPNDGADLNSSNVIKPTLEELSEEHHRRKYDKRLQEFEDESNAGASKNLKIQCFPVSRRLAKVVSS
jgi:hypothetical protein